MEKIASRADLHAADAAAAVGFEAAKAEDEKSVACGCEKLTMK